MVRNLIQVSLILMIMFFTVGCGASEEIHLGAKEEHLVAKEAAWNFLVEKEWDEGVKEGSWQDAEVNEVTVDDDYSLLDESYEEKEVLSVSFENKENLAVGVPVILVSVETNEAVGYMPGE